MRIEVDFPAMQPNIPAHTVIIWAEALYYPNKDNNKEVLIFLSPDQNNLLNLAKHPVIRLGGKYAHFQIPEFTSIRIKN